MAKHFKQLTDAQWNTLKQLMNWTSPLERRVPRADLRKVWNSILYVLTKGCRWADLPRDFCLYTSKSTAHRWLVILKKEHVLDRVYKWSTSNGLI